MEQSSSLKDTTKKYEEALKTMGNLQHAQQFFHSALQDVIEFCDMRTEQISEQEEAFRTNELDRGTIMEHNSLFKDALRGWEQALEETEELCSPTSEKGSEGINLAMQNLEHKHELLHKASKYATESCKTTIKEINEQCALIQMKVLLITLEPIEPRCDDPRHHFVLLENDHRDLDSEAQLWDVTYMLEGSNTALSEGRAELDEKVEHDQDLPNHKAPSEAYDEHNEKVEHDQDLHDHTAISKAQAKQDDKMEYDPALPNQYTNKKA